MNRPARQPRHRRTLDPRIVAPLAFILSVIAVGLVIAYSVARFVNATVHAVPVP